MVFVIPPKSQVGVLDPEIAGEGMKIVLSDGDQVSWTPPPVKPVMPDWSGIKSIAKYFGRSNYPTWPAWLYHPTEKPRIVKNAQEAADLGVCYREATVDERGRYGLKHVWDWTEESQWRPQPHGDPKFDAANPGIGKTVIHGAPNPAIAQNALLEALVPMVTAAVVGAMKTSGNATALSTVDQDQWDKFIQFQAWQKSQESVSQVSKEIAETEERQAEGSLGNALALTPEQERELWTTEAESKGIKVDGRWSLDRLKQEVEKAA